jgi:sugar phosphate isomerase/epimerase
MAILCSSSLFSRSSLEEALRRIHAMGYSLIDLAMIDGWIHVDTTALARDYDATLARVDGLLKRYEMTLLSVNAGFSPLLHDRTREGCARREAEVKALVRFMNHYQIEVAAVQPRNPDPNRPRAEVLRDSAATMRDTLDMAQDTGVTFALECHSGSIVESMDEAKTMIRLVPDLRYAYDPTHFVMKSVDLVDTLPLLERAAQVYLRDAAPGAIQARYGQGTVDFDWILRQLKERGYQGHFSLEYLEGEREDLTDDLLRLCDKIGEWFG